MTCCNARFGLELTVCRSVVERRGAPDTFPPPTSQRLLAACSGTSNDRCDIQASRSRMRHPQFADRNLYNLSCRPRWLGKCTDRNVRTPFIGPRDH